MFREEALWIERVLQGVDVPSDARDVANIGSSTQHFRTVVQPHINTHVIQPLIKRDWKVFNVDLKDAPGVDLVADVTTSNFSSPFEKRFGLTLCSNLLEHVRDIKLVARNLAAITRGGGCVLVTVPHKYKIHPDPIDNGFRPTPDEILDLFPDVRGEVLAKKIIIINDVAEYKIRKSRFPLWGQRERAAYYLGKRHRVSGVLFRIRT